MARHAITMTLINQYPYLQENDCAKSHTRKKTGDNTNGIIEVKQV